MALQQPEGLAERSGDQVGRGSYSHRLLERKMTQMRRRRRGTVGDTEHREAQCHRRSILSTQQSRALQDFTLHSTLTVFEPVFTASYCSRIQEQGLWKWEAGADVEDSPFPRGDRDTSFQQAKPHPGGSTGEWADPGLSPALDHVETQL
ncbi:unnamed protein product [Rangifer tarandus platyrhynchus]|uniref:Uncharacterized protein n=2 Tax=Rangifer tarandus platyrhynchus TaxID=3082113 RepID=A0ABN8ZM08_RANTA|nr:unnamed protein product [Rangifer tarandus platyrhynchus]CAI9706787.1 unnamed protein product [Rangifer tarandus platyrhynchus]